MAGESNGERKIKTYLEEGDIDFEQEYSFPDLKSDKGIPLRFDFAVFTDATKQRIAFIVEFQGKQHYERAFQTAEQFRRQQANDKRKRAYCNSKHIKLVEIPYTDYNEVSLDYLLEKGEFFG